MSDSSLSHIADRRAAAGAVLGVNERQLIITFTAPETVRVWGRGRGSLAWPVIARPR